MTDRTLSLGIETDDSSLKKAMDRLLDIEKAQKKLSASFAAGDTSADKYQSALKELETEAKALNKALDQLEKPRELDIRNDKFDRVSRETGLLGDADSALQTLASVAPGAAGQALGAAGDLFAVAEAIPKLSAAAAGAVPSLLSAAASVGPIGLAAGAAFAVVGVAVGGFVSEMNKQAELLKESANNLRDRNRRIAEGATTEDISNELETLNRQRQAEQATLDRLQQTYDDNLNNLGALGVAIKTVDNREEELIVQIQESEKALEDLDNQIVGWTNSLDAAAVAANNLRAEMEKIADLNSSEAAFQGELVRAKARAAELTQEQIDAEIRRFEVQKEALLAEKAYLDNLVDLTEEQQTRLNQIEEEIRRNERLSQVYENARGSAESSAQAEQEVAKARDETTASTMETAQAERDKAEAEREAARAAEEAARKQEQYAKAITDANTKLEQAQEDFGIDLLRDIADTNTKRLDDIAELEKKFGRDELARERAKNRDLKKIQDDADKQQADALKTRNFLQFADAQEQEESAIKDRLDTFKFEGNERLIEAMNQKDDITDAARQATRDLKLEHTRQLQDAERQRDRAIAAAQQQNSIVDQALSQQLNMFSNWAQGIIGITGQLPGATSGGNNRITSVAGQQNIFAGLFDNTSRMGV